MSKKFGFRSGSRTKGDSQKIGEELERIRKRQKTLTAENTVAAAKSSRSPLHDLFDWNDTEAAHKYRLVQARTLIRSVEVLIPNRSPVRHYVRVHKEGGKRKPAGRYEPMEVVVQNIDEFHSALEMLEEKLSGAVRAVQELREAAGLSKYKGKLAIIGIVVKSLEVASTSLKKLRAA